MKKINIERRCAKAIFMIALCLHFTKDEIKLIEPEIDLALDKYFNK